MAWVRNRVALAIIGAIVVGMVAAGVAALNTRLPSTSTPAAVAAAGAGTQTTTTASSATPSASASSRQSTRSASPTQPPAPEPTATPRPTATSLAMGQLVDLHGTVGTVYRSANQFVLNSTTTITVTVTSATQFQGSISSFQGLRSGMAAEVKGSYQSDGSFVAVLVNAQADN